MKIFQSSLLIVAFCCWGTPTCTSYFAAAFPAAPMFRVAPLSLVLEAVNIGTSRDAPTIPPHPAADTNGVDYDTLLETVNTRKVQPDQVYASMSKLEKQSYRDVRTQSQDTAERIANDLGGDWRPVFSSGSAVTRRRLGGRRVNYFPIKAVISFRPGEGLLQNGLYVGEYHLVRLTGTYQYEAEKRKLRFGYHHISLLNGAIEMDLKDGQDVEFAMATGLGGRIGLWNILLADHSMMMARGAGKGLTLWKRVHGHKTVFPLRLEN